MYILYILVRSMAMTRLNATEARSEFADILNRVAYGKERIVLHRRGKNVAAMVPFEDLELLRKLEDRIDLEDARSALAEVKKKGTIPWKKIKADLGL
jgi:prevent-host-death family protein